jgi:GNAT superfamily N-acetyltransferase
LVCFDGICPDKWLAQFTEVISVMNTAPRAEGVEDVVMTEQQVRANEEAHLRRGGWGWTVCACDRLSGHLVGYTELGGSCHRPWLAEQGDTAVQPAHRNLGLRRWLKATNALRLLEERPDIEAVETWNAGVNAPMLIINNTMGFGPAAEWQERRLDIHFS